MTSKRNAELNRLYAAAGLGVLIWGIFRLYKLLGNQVESGIDAPSRWGLMALGLANLLAIMILLFIVVRSLAKVYFERRSGILGSRIRTRLVVALLAVGILPSLMLYLIGRDFISQNIDRWFKPDTVRVIQDGGRLAGAYREEVRQRVQLGLALVQERPGLGVDELRKEAGLDILVHRAGSARSEESLIEGLPHPNLKEGEGLQELGGGWWTIAVLPGLEKEEWAGGIYTPKELAEGLVRLEKRHRESLQITQNRERFETLPQNSFLFLTLMTIFIAMWVGLALSRTISEPIRALAKAAQRIGMGDLETNLPEEGEDELAFLCRSFNAMTRDLKAGRMAVVEQSERIDRQRVYLGQLLEALPVGVISWQPDGSLRTFNPTARAWVGEEGWDAERDSSQSILDQPRFGKLPQLQKRVKETGRPMQEELRIGSEGEGRPVRAMVVPLVNGGELAVLEDLSLLAQAEKRAAWQEVARRMAHEVKNPLTPIKLTAQRLLRKAGQGTLEPASVAEGAETILLEVTSLQRLVDSFSRFAKLPTPQFRELDAVELVRQVASLYVPNHPRIQWDVQLLEGPLPVFWDEDMVKRVLINFLDNALAVQVEGGRICVSLSEEGGQVTLAVQDEGQGVPPEVRERIFEPYFSTKRKGMGLGLAIVRRIAQDHGGEAHYEPATIGSRFWVTLPRQATMA
ncbi:MAG: putative multisensor signal transduction histidine kinase [Holophagaceae bacterium]|nr:putative multisensor signal transduction histidine kinase [Holophagaceae bacterium]